MRFETKAIHSGQEPDKETGAVIPPIHLSSTFRQDAVGVHHGFEYSRTGNPTRNRLEEQIAALEGAKHGIAFASGSASTATIQLMLNAGDHVICGDDVYGGTFRFFDKVMKRFGLEYDFVDTTNKANVKAAIKENTKLLWLETPTNPLLKISDIEVLAKLAKENDIITVIDNTFATPYIQTPLALGIDIVLHSSTKYMGGHSDMVGGIVLTNSDDLADQLRFLQNSAGMIPSPFDCWLLTRGIKTLHLRMERHCDNALKISRYLEKHEMVKKVFYPHLESHPNYTLAKKQMKLGGGIVSFVLENEEQAKLFLKNLKLFYLAESLGGVESLCELPAEMTHGSIPREMRHEIGISDGLIRLSIGVENADDLIDDLEQAINAATR